MRLRWVLGGILVAALAVTVGLVVVRPRMMAAEARELMANDPCVLGKGPAGPGFFRAIDLAFAASKYPGIDRDETDAAQGRCVAAFLSACLDVEGGAHKLAIRAYSDWAEWRQFVNRDEQAAFCSGWKPLIDLLREGDALTAGGCRYCENWQPK